jgi:hypothetical protein
MKYFSTGLSKVYCPILGSIHNSTQIWCNNYGSPTWQELNIACNMSFTYGNVAPEDDQQLARTHSKIMTINYVVVLTVKKDWVIVYLNLPHSKMFQFKISHILHWCSFILPFNSVCLIWRLKNCDIIFAI